MHNGFAFDNFDQFRRKPPRLVFLDLNMPKMSGFELFTYLRGAKLVESSTVVAMSAGGSPTDVGLMLELGAQDFIPKGPELRGRVTRIVEMLASAKDKDRAVPVLPLRPSKDRS